MPPLSYPPNGLLRQHCSDGSRWQGLVDLGQQLARIPYSSEFVLERRQLDVVYELGTVRRPVDAAPSVGGGGVSDHCHVEAKIRRHPHTGRNAMRRGKSHHHQRLDALRAQIRLEVSSDERAVDVFLEEWLARYGQRLLLYRVSGPTGAQLGLRLPRQVLGVYNGLSAARHSASR